MLGYYALVGCACVDLNNNLVKVNSKGHTIPVSLGAGTVSALDQSYMLDSIERCLSKYDKMIFVTGSNTYADMMKANKFLSLIGDFQKKTDFVVTSGNGSIDHMKLTLGASQYSDKVKSYTSQSDNPDAYKKDVERLLTSLSVGIHTCVFVLGGASCYNMFSGDYNTFYLNRIKDVYEPPEPKILNVWNNMEHFLTLYEDNKFKAVIRRYSFD